MSIKKRYHASDSSMDTNAAPTSAVLVVARRLTVSALGSEVGLAAEPARVVSSPAFAGRFPWSLPNRSSILSVPMKASGLLVRCLESEGVHFVFGLPGEKNLDLLESLRGSPPDVAQKLARRAPLVVSDRGLERKFDMDAHVDVVEKRVAAERGERA